MHIHVPTRVREATLDSGRNKPFYESRKKNPHKSDAYINTMNGNKTVLIVQYM